MNQLGPVTAGARVALTYDLVYTDSSAPPPSLAKMDSQTSRLRSCLLDWKQKAAQSYDVQRYLVHILENEYADGDLALSRMEGADLTRVRCVAKLCEETGFVCYLADMRKEAPCDYGDYGNPNQGEESIDLRRLFDLNNKIVCTGISVQPRHILQHDPWQGRDPEDEDPSDDTSSEDEEEESSSYFRDSVRNFHVVENTLALS